MFRIIVTVIFVLGNVLANETEPDPALHLEACDIGDVIENKCNKCTCTARNVYECTSKDCPKISKVTGEIQANLKGQSCHPHKIYNLDATICICKPDGSWPHISCYSIFRSLPPSHIIKQKCIPDSYVVIDCNVCRCNDKGEIDNERCTKNECDDTSKGSEHRRNSKGGQVFGNCKAKNWYSFAPCQFCYCLNNNKLMCNTGTDQPNAIKLGSYNFSVCGTELLKEALELTPDGKEAVNVMRIGKEAKTPQPAPFKKVTTTTTTTTRFTTKTTNKPEPEVFDLQMSINKNNDKIDRMNSDDYSDSEDEQDNTRGDNYTQQPYVDTDNNSGGVGNRDDRDDEDNSEDESEERAPVKPAVKYGRGDDSKGSIAIKLSLPSKDRIPTSEGMQSKESNPSKHAEEKKGKDKETSVEFDIGAALKNNLPKMLKVISNLRKTVNLDSHTNCVPGTRVVIKCNVCHCLKNNKMICTDNKCD